MDLTVGFWRFKALAVAIECGLFTRLANGGACTLEEAMAELGMHERPADMLLVTCASLGLLEKDGDS
ncbi:methyltransferase family protein [Streptomyces sp. 5.8]|uniref:methyltransferase family protein n=1 Tax=Streptomyces sp. 5.8 TaxID=3406571 RepID=UPI003BB7EF2E